MAKWRVPLQGDDFDLSGLAMRLTGPELQVTSDGEEYFLSGTDFDALPDDKSVFEHVTKLLPIIMGAAHVREGNSKPVTARAVEWTDSSGQQRRSIWATDTGHLRARVRVLVMAADGSMAATPPPEDIKHWTDVAQKDPNVAAALWPAFLARLVECAGSGQR